MRLVLTANATYMSRAWFVPIFRLWMRLKGDPVVWVSSVGFAEPHLTNTALASNRAAR